MQARATARASACALPRRGAGPAQVRTSRVLRTRKSASTRYCRSAKAFALRRSAIPRRAHVSAKASAARHPDLLRGHTRDRDALLAGALAAEDLDVAFGDVQGGGEEGDDGVVGG